MAGDTAEVTTATTPGPVIRLVDVHHRYGATAALDGVSLDIPAGRMIGLIGPDGVGKSTLLGLIAGTRRLQRGTVTVLGGPMASSRHRRAAAPRIAYMPQGLGRNLYPTLSVAENLSFFGRLFGLNHAERRERIGRLTRATGLYPFVNRPAGKLSGGMKQKLGLCCALIHDPDLLILDEPTTGVDPLSRRQFWELIRTLRAERPGMSVLVSTAYMDEAAQFDWLVTMNAGQVLASGTPAEILATAGAASLEDAFIALLPEAQRRDHKALVIPPRTDGDGPPAIEAEGLTRRFGDFTAVDRVSFRIPRGEIFGFLGSNGCGKTTTMKMLTGLLPATDGKAWLFGKAVDPHDIATRRRVGYMAQAFSLYEELTVRHNLELHAQLYNLPASDVPTRVAEMLERFGLTHVAEQRPESLPLGLKQRLSLAVAVIHGPELLILDEPTSGVDPVARDQFWQLLVDLSRHDGVTIFISTHFMNEAERCDRISLMHAGRVLAAGPPAELMAQSNTGSLEEAFIHHLQAAMPPDSPAPETDVPEAGASTGMKTTPDHGAARTPLFSFRRLWAYAARETKEILRDPVRIAFTLIGPLILMFAFGYGISFDVENLTYAALDRDQSPQSRALLENFSGSRYFRERAPLADYQELDRRLRRGAVSFAIEIPPDFGRDLDRGATPEVGVWIDGANAFRAETLRGYVEGVAQSYATRLATAAGQPEAASLPADLAIRFRYNQAFRSIYAIVPGVIMLLLALIPAMMTAVGVVREKENGSIANLYASPTSRFEFLGGKQLPYVGLAYISFLMMVGIAVFGFGVPIKGSVIGLFTGALLYVTATTAYGLMISSFVRTQLAALFAASITIVIPAINFSGFMFPLSSMNLGGQIMGHMFPTGYFQKISVGAFTKGLGLMELAPRIVMVGLFALAFIHIARLLLKKQEA